MTEGPYELPEGWRWVRLGEVVKLKNGKFIRKTELAESGLVRVYGSNGVIGFAPRQKVLVVRETLAIGRVGASGAVNWVVPPAWISDNAMYVVDLAPDCDLTYLFHVLQQSGLSSLAKQGAQPSISQDQVYHVPIPLPPLSEQGRIVAHLEAVQARIQALKEGQAATEAELKRLEQAILEKAFRGELG